MALIIQTSQLKNIIVMVRELMKEERHVNVDEVIEKIEEDILKSIPGFDKVMQNIPSDEAQDAARDVLRKVFEVSQKPVRWSLREAYKNPDRTPDEIINDALWHVKTNPEFGHEHRVLEVADSIFELACKNAMKKIKSNNEKEIRDELAKKIIQSTLAVTSLQRFTQYSDEACLDVMRDLQKAFAELYQSPSNSSPQSLAHEIFYNNHHRVVDFYTAGIGNIMNDIDVVFKETRPGYPDQSGPHIRF